MAVSAARAAAFDILLRVEREDSYASELLHSDALAKLSTRDHGLATELVMGVLRWRSLLDDQLAGASSQKLERLDTEVLSALRLGAYQLRFLSRVPARAAIFESVELVKAARKRSAASFVNAVLRRLGGTAPENYVAEIARSPGAATLARDSAHPLWLVERWIEQYGIATTRQICMHNQTVPSTAIHMSDGVSDGEIFGADIQLSPGKLLARARRVVSGDITAAAAYRDGHIAIQDEASQLVALLAGGEVRRGKPRLYGDSAILDCCAAPGSKTALMARRDPSAKVIAMELHPHRARLLQRLNHLPNVLVIAGDARRMPFSRSFDRILADVPCSGTGTLGRNPEIKWRFKKEDLYDLQSRQVNILKSALGQLSAGGRLVYSTCSLENEENEAVVKAVLEAAPEFNLVDLKSEFERLQQSGEFSESYEKDLAPLLAGPYLRTIPGVHPCDGFFAAMIERS
jgi:16S rRNA (cytosine967-C5)-methyltransferase